MSHAHRRPWGTLPLGPLVAIPHPSSRWIAFARSRGSHDVRRQRRPNFLVLLALFLMPPVVAAATVAAGPRPPCGTASIPPFPGSADPPNVRLWRSEDLGADWRPPVCTGWSHLAFGQLVGLAGRFRSPGDAEDILARFGRISQLTTIRYWSVSHGACRDLINQAFALAGPDADQRRGDFSAEELAGGRILYFFQDDNGPGHGAVYRLRVREVAPDRLILETQNVGTIRVLLAPLFKPGELRALYVLERDARDIWSFYSLTGTTAGASPLARGHDASYVNRALALYGYIAGVEACSAPLRASEGINSTR
jgi:hypothetical protein